MRGPILIVGLMFVVALAGCIAGDDVDPNDAAVDDMPASEPERSFIEWDGHILHSSLDILAHMKDPEGVIFPVQQAGFLVELDEAATAIEVMVSWDAPDAGFRLHPHYEAENDPALGGDTLYYGYLSEMFDESPGCIRIPQADMAAGVWPMMIHPAGGTMGVDYTITVGIEGVEGRVLDRMHGHRSDGASPVEDHGVEPCEFLGVDPAIVEA